MIRDATLAEKYAANWKAHAEHSEAYEGRETRGGPDAGASSAADSSPDTATAYGRLYYAGHGEGVVYCFGNQ